MRLTGGNLHPDRPGLRQHRGKAADSLRYPMRDQQVRRNPDLRRRRNGAEQRLGLPGAVAFCGAGYGVSRHCFLNAQVRTVDNLLDDPAGFRCVVLISSLDVQVGKRGPNPALELGQRPTVLHRKRTVFDGARRDLAQADHRPQRRSWSAHALEELEFRVDHVEEVRIAVI